MGSHEYGRIWELITDDPLASEHGKESDAFPGRSSTPASATSASRQSPGLERKRKASGDAGGYLPCKRSLTAKSVLHEEILSVVPIAKPGIFPAEVVSMLKRISPLNLNGHSLGSFKAQVETALMEMWEIGKLSRDLGDGSNAGSGYEYIRCDAAEVNDVPASKKSLIVVLPLPRSLGRLRFGSDEEYEQGIDFPVRGSPYVHQAPDEEDENIQVVSADPRSVTSERSTIPDRPQHPNDTPNSRSEHAQEEQSSNFTFDPDYWTEENRGTMEKIATAKHLFAQFERSKDKVSTLETRQSQARKQCSSLESEERKREATRIALIAEAQVLREKALELEQEASVCEADISKLQGEIQDREQSLDRRTNRIRTAQEECTRLTRQVLNTVEDALGGDLVNMLSLLTRRTA